MPDDNSPVYEAVSNIVGLFELETKTCVRSYRNEAHFKELWDLLSLKPHQFTELSKTYVIVWDGIPARTGQEDVVDTGKYLSPIDWAVAFSIYILDSIGNKSTAYPDLKIIIFNLSSKSFTESNSLQYIDQFPKRDIISIPWIRIFSPGDGNQGWNMDALINDLTGNAEMPVCSMEYFSKKKSDLSLLKNMWAAFLTKPSSPGDHHALANLVGPLLLTKDNGSDIHVTALSRLMKAIGLLPSGDGETALLTPNDAWIAWKETPWKSCLERVIQARTKLNCILVDDQHEQGWGRILCMALGVPFNPTADNIIGENNIVIKAFDSANDILTTLENLTDKDQRFHFSIGGNKDVSEVLFLDLRLFSGKDEKSEAAFFERLIPLAGRFIEGSVDTLPWKGFTSREIEKVQNWIKPENRKREDDNYVIALTLLPRILALTDMSLPIIIFSSTGRRDIAEKLKPYGNIITAFDKPKFTVDIPVDIAEQTKAKFEAAIEDAFQILAARRKCKLIMERGSDVSNAISSAKKQASNIYVELFIDESRDDKTNRFSVGGCFAVFGGNTFNEARERADQFEDELVAEGIRYFDAFNIGTTPARIKNKKTNSIKELSAVMSKSLNTPLLLGAVRILNDPYRPVDAESDLLHPNSIDNHYRLALNALLELLLFEAVPVIVNITAAAAVSVSLYIATRGRFVKAHLADKIKRERYRFGVEALTLQNGNFIQYSMSKDTIYPFIMDIFSSHEKSISIDRSLGIQLPYKGENIKYPECFVCRGCGGIVSLNTKKDILNGKLTKPLTCPICNQASDLRPDYRALHYIADEILSNFPNEKAQGVYDAVLPASLSSGQFDDTLNEDLYRSILASRALDRGDIISAVGYLLVPGPIKTNCMPTVKEWLVMRTAPLLAYIDGSDFFGMVKQLAEVDYRPYYSAVIKKKPNRYNPNTNIYFGTLQEGPEKGRDVFIPYKLYKARVPADGEVLRIQYFRGDKGLTAQRLAL